MTRTERFAQAEARLKQRLAVQRQHLAQVKARQKRVAQQARNKRYLVVGKLAEEAGLLVLDDRALAGLFRTLGPLVTLPNPVAVLHALLSETRCPHGDGNGCAHPADGVAPTVPVGGTAR